MTKYKIPLYLRKPIYYAHDQRSGYKGEPISFTEIEIVLIIPERVFLNPKSSDEFEKWKQNIT